MIILLKEQVLMLHERLIEATGGSKGIRDEGMCSSLYERLALSRNKEAVLQLSQHGNIVRKPEDLLKQPTVLEFLGLEEKSEYVESDLETAIIDKLQAFLMEMGKGFLFEKRRSCSL